MRAADSPLLENPIIVPHETTLELYRKMLMVFFVEERMKVFVKQGKCSFLASIRGHEKVQIGMTMLLRPGFDWFFPYYCSKALAMGLGSRSGTSSWHAQPGGRSQFERPQYG